MRLGGTSGDHRVQSQAWSPRAGCPRGNPSGFEYLQGWSFHSLSRLPVLVFEPLHINTCFLTCSQRFLYLTVLLVPSRYHWAAVFFTKGQVPLLEERLTWRRHWVLWSFLCPSSSCSLPQSVAAPRFPWAPFCCWPAGRSPSFARFASVNRFNSRRASV